MGEDMNEHHFKTIEELYRYIGIPSPNHPMFAINQTQTSNSASKDSCFEPVAITCDFYTISLKKVVGGQLLYGQSKYDCQNGSIILTAPGQRVVFDRLVVSSKATHISFDKEFLLGHQLQRSIKKYHFFSYSVNEALHISEKEEKLIDSVLEAMLLEYNDSYDSLSKGILLSHLQTLLQYIERFYRRQFLYRLEMVGGMYDKLNNVLSNEFSAERLEDTGLPSVQGIADRLGISAGYLSDSLKIETGKSALDHIHLHLLDVAKELLMSPNLTVTEIAYRLGFEYPQYFSRLFKKKQGVTPTEFRKGHTLR